MPDTLKTLLLRLARPKCLIDLAPGLAIGLVLALTMAMTGMPAMAQDNAGDVALEDFVGDVPPQFATLEEAVEAFQQALANDDLTAFAGLIGLDPERLASAEETAERFAEIQAAAARLLRVDETGQGQQRVAMLAMGDEIWPFPFPLAINDDRTWSFDTYAGLEEVINRRVGENELQAIATLRGYVEAQRDYAAADRDSDGVLEFAGQLVSSPGMTDGLYWPDDLGAGPSPGGAFIDEAELDNARSQNDGYFGYRFRILSAQGDNIAGGRYDYVINGNMIAGFGLIAWPVRYAETGVHSFLVNQAGIVYEKDLGENTAALADAITAFDPDDSWSLVSD